MASRRGTKKVGAGAGDSGAAAGSPWASAAIRSFESPGPSGLAMRPDSERCHEALLTRRQGCRVAAESTTTPASKSRTLTAISCREPKRMRVILPR